jgi:hypothetical protein
MACVGRGIPGGEFAIPKVKLQPLGTSTEMQRIARTSHGAIGLRGSSSVVGDIRNIAAPYKWVFFALS